MPDMGHARSGCCAATGADNCFYVMGGYDGTSRMSSCEYFDPETYMWIQGPEMIKRRYEARHCLRLSCALVRYHANPKFWSTQEWRRCDHRARRLNLRRGRHRYGPAGGGLTAHCTVDIQPRCTDRSSDCSMSDRWCSAARLCRASCVRGWPADRVETSERDAHPARVCRGGVLVDEADHGSAPGRPERRHRQQFRRRSGEEQPDVRRRRG